MTLMHGTQQVSKPARIVRGNSSPALLQYPNLDNCTF